MDAECALVSYATACAYPAQANQGNLDQTLTLAEEMEERDLHYRSVLQTRKLAVAALDIQVERAGENALQTQKLPAAALDIQVERAGENAPQTQKLTAAAFDIQVERAGENAPQNAALLP